jgi:hypothetical protein
MLFAMASAAPIGLAGMSLAQSNVEFRIVERTNQAVVSPLDQVLNFAVQGRVVGTEADVGIGGFAFAIVFNGESPSAGVPGFDRITSADGTYYSGIAGGGGGSTVGVARQYGYLVGISNIFNGMINSSGGGWTQTPSQDIGNISGLTAGSYLLGTPGVDVDQDGTPDGATGSSATLSTETMTDYFGANGKWVDLYRFRYVVTNFSARWLDLHLITTSSDPDPVAFTFSSLQSSAGSWGISSTPVGVSPEDVQGLRVQVIPSPGTAALSLAAACVIAARGGRRRR